MNDDDRWLRELAKVNREEQAEERERLDERWDRLSGGDLSPEEEAELRALAGTSAEAREAYEAFRPLGPGFHDRVARAIREQAKAEAAEPPKPEPRKVLPFPRRLWSAAATLAAAAALFLVLRPPALPMYESELSGGDRTIRGGTASSPGVPVYSPGSLLSLQANPFEPPAEPVEARAFAARGAELVPLGAEPVVENGSVLLRGTVGREIRLPPGPRRIWLVVGWKGKIPPVEELAAEIRAGRTLHKAWQALPADLRIAER